MEMDTYSRHFVYDPVYCRNVFFWESSDAAMTYLTRRMGIDRWLHQQKSGILSFFF